MKRVFQNRYLYRNFAEHQFNPFSYINPQTNPESIEEAAFKVFHWAEAHGARYYSFLAYPQNGGISEKQETFMKLKLEKGNLIRHLGESRLHFEDLLRGEGDGSSFPNGGLRETANARAYFIWDWKAPVFIRKRNGVLYIPSLLLTHTGEALDDKTLFRQSENLIEKATFKILKTLNHDISTFLVVAGLEQEFFVIKKEDYDRRLDLQQTGRALFGRMPPHAQQFSDHYYAKLQPKIERVLREAEDELLAIGVPIKTRHKEVAPNQYEIAPIFTEASRAIDQNMMMMKILEEAFERENLVPLWHQKPFRHINGSGKHINWSLGFYNNNGVFKNLFKPKDHNDQLFLLFALLNIKAILNNQELFLASVAVPGNELRLGGHEAPPRIISAFVGATVKNMIENLPPVQRENLRNIVGHLITDVHQSNTDRNRTSPYAFTANRFEFRAVGSSQNGFFPLTVILTTMAAEIEKANDRLQAGESLETLIKNLAEETASVRFNGNGYSQEWVDEAKKRNLYINDKFTDTLDNVKKFGGILVKAGVYSQRELEAKSTILKESYLLTVQKEVNTFLILINKEIIPRAYTEMRNFPTHTTSAAILKRGKQLETLVEKLALVSEDFEKRKQNFEKATLLEMEELRADLIKAGELVDEITDLLPESPTWPEMYQVLGTL